MAQLFTHPDGNQSRLNFSDPLETGAFNVLMWNLSAPRNSKTEKSTLYGEVILNENANEEKYKQQGKKGVESK
jgi:hypothetical protein